ncbi:MAG: amidohydrolase family protein [Myxococcales bacterium]|nr:amidohydrolase family protein [Myxococcales bacterium]
MTGLLLTVAIVSATVYTGEGPPLREATVVIDGNRVTAVGTGLAPPKGARIIDARSGIVTPGLIDGASRVGLVGVRLESQSVEGTLGPDADPVRAALRVSDTFDAASFVLPVARSGGLTSAAIIPQGGILQGQSAWIDLIEDDPVRRSPLALHVSLGSHGSKAGSRSRAFLRLRQVLEDTRLVNSNRGLYLSGKLRPISVSAADLAVISLALERELPVVFEVDRAADIRTVLQIARTYRLRAILLGAAEGWKVADEIAAADVPALVNPFENLPSDFDRLDARADNGLLLHRAGISVGFTLRGAAHFAPRLRQAAGNAVRNGFPYDAAVAAITSVPARIFRMVDTGVLRPGALANLVIWNGDPLELTSWPTRMLIRGREIELRSRQDQLTERYLTLPLDAPGGPGRADPGPALPSAP